MKTPNTKHQTPDKHQAPRRIALLSAFCFLLSAFAFSGCAAGKGQLNPATGIYDTNATASTIVVTVEKTRATALDSFALLMETEYNLNLAGKSTPAIHAFVEDIRKNGQGYLDDLTRAKTAFQVARGSPSETAAQANLNAALAGIQSLIASAAGHFVTLSKH